MLSFSKKVLWGLAYFCFFLYVAGVLQFPVSSTYFIENPAIFEKKSENMSPGDTPIYRVSRPFQKLRNENTDSSAKTTDSRVVLLDFYGDYCGPCRTMNPVIDRLRARGFSIRKVNTSQEQELSAKFRITSIPCFVVLADGKEISRTVGVTSETDLAEMMHRAGKTLQTESVASSPAVGRGQNFAVSASPRSAWRGKETASPTEEIIANRWNPPKTPAASGRAIPSYTIPTVPADTLAQNGPRNAVGSGESASPEVTVGGKPIPFHNISMMSENAAAKRSSEPKDLLASTVRIHIKGGQRASTGSGTIIDCRDGRALVLTCGHLFSDYRREDQITVDLFGEGGRQNVAANYISHDYRRNDNQDLAVISIPVTEKVQVSPLASETHPLRKGMAIITSGCSHGAVPTIQKGVVTGVNRYLGSPNLVVSVQPVEGRSGGGVFSAEGELLGVCNAADPENNEGIYTSLGAIHEYLNRIQLSKFANAPRNESLLAANDAGWMPANMPESGPVRQLTDLPRASGENASSRPAVNPPAFVPVSIPAFASAQNLPASASSASPREEILTASAADITPTAAPENAPRSLMGTPLPAWPPRW